MPADCAYCGQAVDGDGFICSRCAGSPQAPLQYSFEPRQQPTAGAHPDSGSEEARKAVEVQHNFAPEADQKPLKREPEPARTSLEKAKSDTRTKKKADPKKTEKKISEAKKAEIAKAPPGKKNKSSAKEWKKQKVHQDFTARTKAIKMIIQTMTVIIFMLGFVQSVESNRPISAFVTLAVAGIVLLIIGLLFKVILFFHSSAWARFATYIYHHRPPQECQVKLIFVRQPYTVGELVVVSQSGKQQKRSRFRVVLTNANPALFMRSIESSRLPEEMFRGSIRRGSTEGLEAAIVTIGECRFWCVPDTN